LLAGPRKIVLLKPDQKRIFEPETVIYAPWGVNVEGENLSIYSGRSIKAESQPASAKFRSFMNITDPNLQNIKNKDLGDLNKTIKYLKNILNSLKDKIKYIHSNCEAIKKELILAQYFIQFIDKGYNQRKPDAFLFLVHSFDQIVAHCKDKGILENNLVYTLEYLEKHKLMILGDQLEPDQIYELIKLLVYGDPRVNNASFALNINFDKKNKPVFKTYSGLYDVDGIYRLTQEDARKNYIPQETEEILLTQQRIDFFVNEIPKLLARKFKTLDIDKFRDITILLEKEKKTC
jgi:hypothetical protein